MHLHFPHKLLVTVTVASIHHVNTLTELYGVNYRVTFCCSRFPYSLSFAVKVGIMCNHVKVNKCICQPGSCHTSAKLTDVCN